MDTLGQLALALQQMLEEKAQELQELQVAGVEQKRKIWQWCKILSLAACPLDVIWSVHLLSAAVSCNRRNPGNEVI